jgi:methionyl-tRNA formyltransferase
VSDGVLLLGGTDVTIAVAEAILEVGATLNVIVDVGQTFSISYSGEAIVNSRSVDIAGWGRSHGVPVATFTGYDDVIVVDNLSKSPLCLAAGWYHMIPRRFRERFPLGCFGFHASLLPQLRGGAPLNWAILCGLVETGVTFFELADGVDNGPIYAQERLPITERARIGDLVAASRQACAKIVRLHLLDILAGRSRARIQTGTPSYGLQRGPQDGQINWLSSAHEIDRLVRATGRPYPGAFTTIRGRKLLIWASDPAPPELSIYGAPGQVARIQENPLPCVVTGKGALFISEATDVQGEDMVGVLLREANARLGD